ncbi:helix-turn-helix transcriptional regulator [Modestobacter excelsi]|uniref:helix-turn-helix transcriptional regulator n=1 Tax=Modestobacter excelsi TaxID=2213161 RepID=UPI001C20CF12|nr:helix-turn-helix domain-containing protein [Modestobacter excelsi]
MTDRLLTTEEVAARFRTSPATVRYWRHIGIGPSGIKVGVGCSTTRPSATDGGSAKSRRRSAASAEQK